MHLFLGWSCYFNMTLWHDRMLKSLSLFYGISFSLPFWFSLLACINEMVEFSCSSRQVFLLLLWDILAFLISSLETPILIKYDDPYHHKKKTGRSIPISSLMFNKILLFCSQKGYFPFPLSILLPHLLYWYSPISFYNYKILLRSKFLWPCELAQPFCFDTGWWPAGTY